MTTADAAATSHETYGRCTGCGEIIRLSNGALPPHMWPHSTPLLIACSGSGQPPEESRRHDRQVSWREAAS